MSTLRTLASVAATLLGIAVIAAAVVAGINLTRLPTPPDTASTTVPPPTVRVQTSTGTGPTGDGTGAGTSGAPDAPGAGAAAGAGTGAAAGARVDPAWIADVSATTGIPARALVAYATADLTVDAEQPACGIGWNTLAAIGRIESDHGRHDGAVLGDDGYPNPPIRGIPLDGTRSAEIPDTDQGTWDGDPVWDRAVGPMQFIPDTWSRWGADGNRDGTADPNQIDDAALAAARYLCASGPLTTPDGWRTAIFSYNNLDSYVTDVANAANAYATQAQPRP